jgi:hypothetical protein
VRPVASVPQAQLPAEEAAAASDAKVQPPEAAEARLGPSAQQPGAAEVAEEVSAPSGRPPEAEEAASGAAVQPPEAAGVALDAEAEPRQAVAAAGRPDAEVPQPGVAGEPAPSVRQPAEGHPSAAPWACRPGQPLPWLAPRRAVRSAHAMRRSRAASPSRRSWRAAGCEGLS